MGLTAAGKEKDQNWPKSQVNKEWLKMAKKEWQLAMKSVFVECE
jgi:hypothetical protein